MFHFSALITCHQYSVSAPHSSVKINTEECNNSDRGQRRNEEFSDLLDSFYFSYSIYFLFQFYLTVACHCSSCIHVAHISVESVHAWQLMSLTNINVNTKN